MKRPSRTIRRESKVTLPGTRSKFYPDGRPLVLIVPPTCDVLLIREKGRRTVYEVPALAVFSIGAKLAALKTLSERKAKRGRR